jgi:hypothetical protein
MLATPNPHFLVKVLNFYFILSYNAFSPTLFANNVVGSSLDFRNPVICAINCISIDIGVSSHKVPLWTQLNNRLMQAFISRLPPKFGIYNKFNIPAFSSLAAQLCGSTNIAPILGTLLVRKYLSRANSRNLCAYFMSWTKNFKATTLPIRSASIITPSGMSRVINGYLASLGSLTYGGVSFLSHV